jgi:hypothetical protein
MMGYVNRMFKWVSFMAGSWIASTNLGPRINERSLPGARWDSWVD